MLAFDQNNHDITGYIELNNSFTNKAVYSLGWHGLFSELLLMCTAMLYAADNNYRFELDSNNTGFLGKNGFEILWNPLFPISKNRLYRRRTSSGFKNHIIHYLQSLLLKTNSKVLSPDILHRKILDEGLYLHDFKLPGSSEKTDFLTGLNYYFCLIMDSLKDDVKANIKAQIEELKLPENYVAIQIRRGDKVEVRDAGARLHSAQEYTNLINEKCPKENNIYIISDDYRAIDELIKYCPQFNLIHRVAKSHKGYQNTEFVNLPKDQKVEKIIKLIADFFICVNSEHFIGPFSSNFSRAVGTARLNKDVTSIDTAWPRYLYNDSSIQYLAGQKGVIHIGANLGQEKELYRYHNLDVIWIEPIPEVFSELEKNIEDYPKQKAYQHLITDKNGKEYQFNIANNNGASSSILDFNQHKDIWPGVEFEKQIKLTSITLSKFIDQELVDLSKYDTLIMDTQGSELLVLKGAENLLTKFKFIRTEAADFEAYKNCCQLSDLDEYLTNYNFKQISKTAFARRDQGGQYYDVTYQNLCIR